MTLFAAVLISKDRESALLQRLYTTPLTASDFIFGYTLPILPIAVAQGVICYIAAALLGLKLTITVLYALLFLIPVALFYIALGLICGSVLIQSRSAVSVERYLPICPLGCRGFGLM